MRILCLFYNQSFVSVILVYPGILYPSFDGLTSVRNVGELAEGWYDPATLQKAQSSAAAFSPAVAPPTSRPGKPNQINSDPSNESSDGDSVGPALPGNERALHQRGRKSGPAIPDLQDLDFQRGMFSGLYLLTASIWKILPPSKPFFPLTDNC